MPTESSPEVEAFATYCATRRGLRPATVAAYRADLEALALFGPVLDHQATTAHLENTLDRYAADSGAGAARLRRVTMTLRAFGAWAVAVGLRPTNAAAALPTPRPTPPVPAFLSQEEAERLDVTAAAYGSGAADAARASALVALLLWAGLRVGEVVEVRPRDLDQARALLTVRGKGGHVRTVPLAPRALASLAAWAEARDARAPWWFHTRAGERFRPREVQRIVAGIARAAGIGRPVSPHTLRHTFATLLYAAGAGIVEIQQLLGHASLATTQLYTHTTPRRLAGAVALFPDPAADARAPPAPAQATYKQTTLPVR